MIEKNETSLQEQVLPVPGTNLQPSDRFFLEKAKLYSKEVYRKILIDDIALQQELSTKRKEPTAYARKNLGIPTELTIPDWLLLAVEYKQKGEHLVLSIKRCSDRTVKFAPIFDAILTSFDLCHSLSDNNDAGLQTPHDKSTDMFLRHRVLQNTKTPIFVQLQRKEQNWRGRMRTNSGGKISLTYSEGILRVTVFPSGETTIFEIKTMKM